MSDEQGTDKRYHISRVIEYGLHLFDKGYGIELLRFDMHKGSVFVTMQTKASDPNVIEIVVGGRHKSTP